MDLPLFDQDLEQAGPSRDRVIALHERFEAADGLIVASPEYNASVSPYLKNTIDWISRLAHVDARFADSRAFLHKPLLLASASTGWSGGTLGLQSARTIFAYLGCLVNAEQICVSYADHWAMAGQFGFDPAFAAYIERTLQTFVSLVERLANVPVPQAKQASYA